MDKNSRTTFGFALKAAQRLALSGAALAALAAAPSPASAAGAERSLAGIAIFAPGSEVTHKFGNPNQILVGGVGPAANTPGGSAGQGGSSGQSGYPGSQSGQGGFPGSGSSSGGTGQLPGFPGVPSGGGFPGSSSSGFPGGASGFPGSAAAAAPVKPPVTLVYNRPNGGSLEFTISPDKRVVQIRETGYSGSYGTGRGIKLGTSYSAVVARYGYPENTEISGSIINIDYKDTLHCGFQFLDQRLVGIIVASPD